MPTLDDVTPVLLDLLLFGATLLVLAVDLGLPHGRKRGVGMLAAVLLFGLLIASFFMKSDGTAFSGAYVGGPWAMLLKRIALAAGGLCALAAVDHVDRHFPRRQGEFYLLLMFSVLGMTLLPGANDLIVLLVCFELMGIPLAMLAGYAKADDPRGVHRFAAEAGLKLYFVSAASTAITLFGLSLVYGMAGSTRFPEIGAVASSPLLSVGMLMTIAGMAFKVGAVPFHFWVPDTYQGAPTPFVAFLSVAPKATGMAALGMLVLSVFRAHGEQLQPLLVLLIVASIVVGNLMALPQRDVKRILGFSGVAQIGYVLMGLVAGGGLGVSTVLFYLVGYVVTNMGAFFVLEAIAGDRAGVSLDEVKGLWKRSPWLALAMLTFLLSLAGIPFVVGFWAKLYVFLAAYRSGHGWFVFFGALMAIVALWYYLQIARAAYMEEPAEGHRPIHVRPLLATAIGICLFGVVFVGAWPGPFIESAREAAASLEANSAGPIH
jgi:NADH-quinone oxidoreductase subunit N